MIGQSLSWLYLSGKRRPRAGPFAKLKIGLVADELTTECLSHECLVYRVTPRNHRILLKSVKPDLLLVESAWTGFLGTWKYRIATYPEHPARTNAALAAVVARARDLNIPAVFWNREDAVHFDRFIASARLFDTVFTVDGNCEARYRTELGPSANIGTLMFAAQPAIHAYREPGERRRRACFLGSYGRHVHDVRRNRQDMLLDAAARSIGLTVYDRNSSRRGAHYRYPDYPGIEVQSRIAHARTAEVYRGYMASLNVNTVEDSPTMFSRRLTEILSCGGLAVTTPALSVDRHFKDFCHVIDKFDEAEDVFTRLARGYSARDREMMRAGADHVARHHSYRDRLETVLAAVGKG